MKAWSTKPRRGSTLVMALVMLAVFLAITAMVIDLSKIFVIRSQLNNAADAGAMAATWRMAVKGNRNTSSRAFGYKYSDTLNRVDDGAIEPADSIIPGVYTVHDSTFTPSADWTAVANNAVRVYKSRTKTYSAFAGLIGATTKKAKAEATAAMGYVQQTNGLIPWVVDYQILIDKLHPPAGTFSRGSYNLTAADIVQIENFTSADEVRFGDVALAPGNIGPVQVNTPWNGNNDYTYFLGHPGEGNISIGPGTWLLADPGAGSGQTSGTLKTLCGTSENGQNFTCTLQPKLAVALFYETNGLNGANTQYHVKTVVGLVITRYVGSGQPANRGVFGYFANLRVSGPITGTPSPLRKVILVK